MATQIERVGVGEYIVYLNALSDLYPYLNDNGHLQVSAYNVNPVHCAMRVAADESPTPLIVRCFDAAGTATDSRFTVSYSYDVNVLGTTPARGNAYVRNGWADPPYVSGWWNASGEPSVVHVATGRYQVRFPALATSRGYAIASTQEASATYCNVSSWFSDGMDQLVNVRCYDAATATLTDQDFGVAFTA